MNLVSNFWLVVVADPYSFLHYRLFSISPTLEYRDPRYYDRWRHPSNRSHRWEPLKPLREIYGETTEPVPVPRTGGRGPNGTPHTSDQRNFD